MPDGEDRKRAIFAKEIIPWNEIELLYSDQYPDREFWASLRNQYPEGYRVPWHVKALAFAPDKVPAYEKELLGYLNTEYQRITGLKVEEERIPTTAEDWLVGLDDEERLAYDQFINNMQQRNRMLNNVDLSQDQMKAIDDYLFSVWEQAQGLITTEELAALEEQGLSGEELDRAIEDLTWTKVQAGELDIAIPDTMKDIMDDEVYRQKIQIAMKVLPDEYLAFAEEHLAGLPPDLKLNFARLAQISAKEIKHETLLSTGQEIAEVDTLSRIDEQQLDALRQRAISQWLRPELATTAPLSLVAPEQALRRVARYTGMTQTQYLQSAFQDWKIHLDPTIAETRGNEQLWREFITGAMGEKLGQRTSLLGYIEADMIGVSEAVGAERETVRGRLTPLYEEVTAPWGVPGEKLWGVPSEKAELPTGELQPAAEQPAGAGGAEYSAEDVNVEWTRTQAQAGYMRELKKRGYGPEDIGYLSQFFNVLVSGPWPRTLPRWQIKKAFEGMEIPSPPRREAPKTRFVRKI